MVLSKVLHLSSVHSLKASLLHRFNNLLSALLQVTPVHSHVQQVRDLLKARDLLLVRVLLGGVRGVPHKLRDSSLSPSSRNPLQEVLARNPQGASPSSKGPPSLLGSCHREGNRGLLTSRVDLEHPLPSSLDLLLQAKGGQEDDPLCSKSLSPHRNPVRTTRLWAPLHN